MQIGPSSALTIWGARYFTCTTYCVGRYGTAGRTDSRNIQAAADRPTFSVFRQPTHQGAMAQVNKGPNITFQSIGSWEMLHVGWLFRRHLAQKTETWFSYAARRSLTHSHRAGPRGVVMESHQFVVKQHQSPFFCPLHRGPLGHPQRSTSSRLAVMPPARGKTV